MPKRKEGKKQNTTHEDIHQGTGVVAEKHLFFFFFFFSYLPCLSNRIEKSQGHSRGALLLNPSMALTQYPATRNYSDLSPYTAQLLPSLTSPPSTPAPHTLVPPILRSQALAHLRPLTMLVLCLNALPCSFHGSLFFIFKSLLKCYLLREALPRHPT